MTFTGEILDLMDQLPVDRDENLERLIHAETYCHI